MNARGLRSAIMKMESGHVFYYNAIAGTPGMVDVVRDLIKKGVIEPEKESIDNMIVESARYKYYSGESILPQGNYIKK